MSNIRVATRVEQLPTYIFAEINKIKERVKKEQGIDLLSLAIGDPDKPTPPEIVAQAQKALAKPENHVYSPYEGTVGIRTAFANFAKNRFGISLDPQREIIALIGSKEGLAHFPLSYVNPGDKCLYPNPCFPMYATAITLAGGEPVSFPLSFENKFLPDLNQLESQFKSLKPRFIYLNYPHNPTSAVCPKDKLTEIVALAKKYNVVIAYDNAYSELYFDEKDRPISIFEVPGAKDIAIEFHSMSKTYNMTGWRLAFAVGNETLVQALLKVKTNIDSGPVMAVQDASIWALDHYEQLNRPIRKMYLERRTVVLDAMDKLGIEYIEPRATFYLWARVPTKQSSFEFVKGLIEDKGLVLTPGVGFGSAGEGFFRMAMTVDVPHIHDAMNRLADYIKKH